METENIVISEENTTLETPQDCYVRHSEFAELKADVKDIRDNHLATILASVKSLAGEVKNIRWTIAVVGVVLAIVLTILQVLG